MRTNSGKSVNSVKEAQQPLEGISSQVGDSIELYHFIFFTEHSAWHPEFVTSSRKQGSVYFYYTGNSDYDVLVSWAWISNIRTYTSRFLQHFAFVFFLVFITVSESWDWISNIGTNQSSFLLPVSILLMSWDWISNICTNPSSFLQHWMFFLLSSLCQWVETGSAISALTNPVSSCTSI